MNRLLIILFFLSNIVLAQKNEKFIASFLLGDELKTSNVIEQYNQFDFSNIWLKTQNHLIYGIIGAEHQRIRMKLISVEKNINSPSEYIVLGKSDLKENICDFNGLIRITEIKEVEKFHYGVDNEYEDRGIKSQGIIIAYYEFKENNKQKGSGVFKGRLYSKWYLDFENQIQYDDIQIISDGYSNNAFIGNWTSYKTEKEKICNWSDFRVPMANKDFDIGVAEFNVSEKYWSKGWLEIALKNRMPNGAIKENKPKLLIKN